MRRIWAECVADNVSSVRVLEKIGMRLEARELKKEFIKNIWRDYLIFAIQDRNWIK